MPFSCKILLDSVNPIGSRLTTFELSYPRFIHSEVLTHRLFSRNASSSRAIPVQKLINQVMDDPAIPVHFGKNQKGMVAQEELDERSKDSALKTWLEARDGAVKHVRELIKIGVHKQVANRILEPWMYITVILSGTSFGNFFNLRCQPDAQPEMNKIACMMRDSYYANTPTLLNWGDFHTPLIQHEEYETLLVEDRLKVSAGRCARISYLTHEGKRDIQADLDLCDRLIKSHHMSPLEHVAKAEYLDKGKRSSNFDACWTPYRKTIEGEHQWFYKTPGVVS